MVTMKYINEKAKHVIEIPCDYNKELYKKILKNRWDFFDDEPIEDVGKLCYLLRRVCNDDNSRYLSLGEIISSKTKVIVFYNFNYELERLRVFFQKQGFEIGEWNGQLHTDLPTGEKWAYLCQYTAACEGWNCQTTDTIIFFSQNYSYKITEQAAGRIDRINSPFKDLYYYHLRSTAPIDLAIKRALALKRNFNEKIFMKGVTM
jgi:hypothetical protein